MVDSQDPFWQSKTWIAGVVADKNVSVLTNSTKHKRQASSPQECRSRPCKDFQHVGHSIGFHSIWQSQINKNVKLVLKNGPCGRALLLGMSHTRSSLMQ